MLSIILAMPDSDGTVTTHLCTCFERGAFAPDGCCLLLGLAACVFSLLLLR